jgi:hypothetical protein
MQNDILIDSPPPYQLQADGIYLPEMDSNAWPSSYYGRTRRIDLAKFYHDILKASTNEEDQECIGFIDSSSDEEEQQQLNQNNTISVTTTNNGINGTSATAMAENNKHKKVDKKVRFSEEAPMIYEYEPEYDELTTETKKKANLGGVSLFDEGWPGRTKVAMKSDGFMDFKAKIEAQLGAINDPSLISQLDSSNESIDESTLMCNQEESPLYRGYYRHRKSPLVEKLNLRPIPNAKQEESRQQQEQPSLVMDDTPSPSNSYTDSPITPKDNYTILPPLVNEPSISSTSSTTSSILSPGGSKWLNRTLSKLRSNSTSSSRSK